MLQYTYIIYNDLSLYAITAAKAESKPAIIVVDESAEKAKPHKSASSNPTEAAGNSKENSTAVKKPAVNVASSEKTKPSNNWLLFKSV
jgi:hypothetical protein